MKQKIILLLLFVIANFYMTAQLNTEHARLSAFDKENGGFFGCSVDIYGEYAVVGSKYANNGIPGSTQGSAYIYKNIDGNWKLLKKLAPLSLAHEAYFGSSVSIYGDYIVVSAPNDTVSNIKIGSVYVFKKNAGGNDNWGQVAKLHASDGKAADYFGMAAFIYNDLIVVGAPNAAINNVITGVAYVFRKNSGNNENWEEIKKLIPNDPLKDKRFGISLSVYEDNILVGAYGNDNTKINNGSAYLFGKDIGGTDKWSLIKKIVDTESLDYDKFGYSVSVFKDYLLIGATNKDFNAGSALIYKRNSGGTNNWGHIKTIKSTKSDWGEEFGKSVDMNDDYLVIGCANDMPVNTTKRTGSVSVFKRTGAGIDQWIENAYVYDTIGQDDEEFGKSVAIYNNQIIVGAEDYDGQFNHEGLAFIFGGQLPFITGQTLFSYNVCPDELLDFQIDGNQISEYEWQVKYSGSSVFEKITDNAIFNGSSTSILTVNAKYSIKDAKFRCKVINSFGYKISAECGFVFEKEVPVITSFHPNLALSANSSCQYVVPDFTTQIIATDDCSTEFNFVQNPVKGTIISGEVNKITLTVTDQAFNTASVEFNIKVVDNSFPIIKCISSKVIEISQAENTYTVSGTEFDPVSVNDNCGISGVSNNINNKASLAGEKLSVGKAKIVWTAKDNSYNENNCEFEVEVKKTVGLNDNSLSDLIISPVPVNEYLFVQTDKSLEKIIISDVTGKKIKTMKGNVSSAYYVGDLNPGVYFIMLDSGRENICKKFLKI